MIKKKIKQNKYGQLIYYVGVKVKYYCRKGKVKKQLLLWDFTAICRRKKQN